ncbi:leucine-rich repeat-containing protein egg-6-like [Coccinella septempunctata]|uniref:leucine-rich repeat-containing protein egg-6-like n=1 Tax=Coccinella septempunctata TaxID=41139 RepID=UPI001D07E458|nr:leucine-rich repeat-containing protein egg-6-like [Coccinella septempunctata]
MHTATKMIFRISLLLISLTCYVHSQNLTKPKDDVPVSLLALNNVVIEDYHGPMDSKTLNLFENVETLAFQGCNFTKFNENFLHPLKKLRKLIIANSHFDRVKDDISICCKNLREIELIQSDIGGVTEDGMKKVGGMKTLERLYFFRLDAPKLFAKSLEGSNLKTLEIEYSNLATIEDGAFDGMDKLEVLNLQKNKIDKFPTKNLASLKNLKELNLKGNLLTKVTTEDFPALPNLEKVNLGHNPIKEIDLKGLKEKLPKLKQVDVSGIEIDLSKNEGVPLIKQQVL